MGNISKSVLEDFSKTESGGLDGVGDGAN